MKKPWLGIVSLLTAGVIGLGVPAAHAADCLDHLAGNSYDCSGEEEPSGSSSTSPRRSVTRRGSPAGSTNGTCCATAATRATPPIRAFGTAKTVASVGKPRELSGFVQTLSFAAQVANRPQIKKGHLFAVSTSPGGIFTGGLSAAECRLLP